MSFGVVEHFEDTANCLKACGKFLKPDGTLFTLIPNITGIIGYIQKIVDKQVYDVHVPLCKDKLAIANTKADLDLIACEYFMSISLSIVNSGSFSQNRFNKLFRHVISSLSKICWILEKYGLKIPVNKLTSPYIISVAKIKS